MKFPSGAPRSPEEDARHLLRIYLNDHHSAAVGGVALARRCRSTNAGSSSSAGINEIVREIEEDLEVLNRLMTRLHVKPNLIKVVAARTAVELGRLKLNGRIVSSSPLSRVIELEALVAGVEGKSRLWAALAVVLGGGAVEGFTFDQLVARAHDQRDRLELHHRDAVRAAFGAANLSI